MCYICHTLGNNPSAPAHTSKNCRDPRNSHSRYFVGDGAAAAVAPVTAAAVAPAVAAAPCRGEIRTYSLQNRIQPKNVDVARGAKIWDGSTWRPICGIQQVGTVIRVFWVDGPMGTPEKYMDF